MFSKSLFYCLTSQVTPCLFHQNSRGGMIQHSHYWCISMVWWEMQQSTTAWHEKIHFTINHRLFNPLQTLGANILSYKNKGTYLRGVWKIFECTYQLTAFLILKLHKNPAHQQKAHDFISIVFDHVENIFFTIWLWMVMVFLQHSTIFVIVCRLQLLWTATLCYSTLTAIWQP